MFIFLAFFCLAWNAFLVVGLSESQEETPMLWLFLLFPIVHVAVGVGLTYYTLAGFLNFTEVTVRGGTLTVRQGPLPWKGNRTLSAIDLAQPAVRGRDQAALGPRRRARGALPRAPSRGGARDRGSASRRRAAAVDPVA